VPTTPPDMVQTISPTFPTIVSQGAPTPHSERTSPLKILAQTPVPPSRPPVPAIPAPALATQFAANSTYPATTTVSLHGSRVPAPPSGGTSRTTNSFPAAPEASSPPPRPVPVSGGDSHQRLTEGETDRDLVRFYLPYGPSCLADCCHLRPATPKAGW
jgi:hypothetical protein